MYKRKNSALVLANQVMKQSLFLGNSFSKYDCVFCKNSQAQKKNLETKSKQFLFQKVASFICLIESTVQSKIIPQIKRERLLSQHIKVINDFSLLTPAKRRKMSNSTSKMGENISSHLTTVDKNFVQFSMRSLSSQHTTHYQSPSEKENSKLS